MVSLKDIYYDLGKAMKGVCDKLYPRNRPAAVDESIGSYIVVSLPSVFLNNEMNDSGTYRDYSTTAHIEVYVRDKVSSKNPNGFMVDVVSEKVSEVISRFPIDTANMLVSKPRVTLQANDGNGFSVTIIQCSLRTK